MKRNLKRGCIGFVKRRLKRDTPKRAANPHGSSRFTETQSETRACCLTETFHTPPGGETVKRLERGVANPANRQTWAKDRQKPDAASTDRARIALSDRSAEAGIRAWGNEL